MLTYVCDRCGKLIRRPDNGLRYIVEYGTANYTDFSEEQGVEVESIDLCESCYKSFCQWQCMYVMGDRNEERK